MDNMNTNFVALSEHELLNCEGGVGIFEDIGRFVGGTWNVLYQTGRDFGRSIVNAAIK
ncbi:TPA: alcohol dehydrogenase [Streptococcus suis]|nr:alcohol dehydrogenase [Streptococcus suis]